MNSKKWAVLGLTVLLAGSALWAAAPAAVKPAKPEAATAGTATTQPDIAARVRQMILSHIARMIGLHAELGLTDQQRAQIHDVVVEHKKEIASVALEVVQKRRALRDQVRAEPPNDAAIRAAADQLGKAIGDAAVLGSKLVAEIRPVLTPEQIAKIKAAQKETATDVDDFLQKLAAE